MTAKLIPLAFDGQAPPTAWPSVSLCMIVKDEAANLAACLESVGDFAGELIVVDTGSGDRTVEIAESFGAQVRHFAWVDDFAAARNESIKDARGEWIFWMDADDRLSPENLVRLKHAVASGQADAFLCRVLSRGGSLLVASHLRLFRNGLELQFERPLHEDATPAALRQGLAIAQTNVTIEHLGYDSTPEMKRRKAVRNGRILEQCLARNPGDLYWRFHQGSNLYLLEDFAGAAAHLEAVLADPPDSLRLEGRLCEAHALLVATHIELGSPERAQRAVDRALAAFPTRRYLWILAGKFYLAHNLPLQAVAALERASRLSLEADLPGIAWPPGTLETLLGQAYRQQGRYWRARGDAGRMVEAFAQAMEIAPPGQQAEACKLLAAALQQAGREDEAVACWQMAKRLAPASSGRGL